MVILVLRQIFQIVFAVSLIHTAFSRYPTHNKKTQENSGDKTKNWDVLVQNIEYSIALLLLLSIVLYVVIKLPRFSWVITLFGLPVYLSRIVEASISIGIVGRIVTSNDSGRISEFEVLSIEAISYALWLVESFGLIDKCLRWVQSMSTPFLGDFCRTIVYISLTFLYIFLISALIPRPLSFVAKYTVALASWLKSKFRLHRIEDYFIKQIGKPVSTNSLLVASIRNKEKYHFCIVVKTLKWLLAPIFLLIDILLIIIKVFLSLIGTTLGYLFFLLQKIGNIMERIIHWINNLSDRRALATSFRVASIVSLSLVVAVNRYEPFLHQYDASTAIMEFIASSIIIPVVFEWIGEIRTNNSKK